MRTAKEGGEHDAGIAPVSAAPVEVHTSPLLPSLFLTSLIRGTMNQRFWQPSALTATVPRLSPELSDQVFSTASCPHLSTAGAAFACHMDSLVCEWSTVVSPGDATLSLVDVSLGSHQGSRGMILDEPCLFTPALSAPAMPGFQPVRRIDRGG